MEILKKILLGIGACFVGFMAVIVSITLSALPILVALILFYLVMGAIL